MARQRWIVILGALLVFAIWDASADFLAPFELTAHDQIGGIRIEKRGDEFWAVCGPTDTEAYFSYRVAFLNGLAADEYVSKSITVIADVIEPLAGSNYMVVQLVFSSRSDRFDTKGKATVPWSGAMLVKMKDAKTLRQTYRNGKVVASEKVTVRTKDQEDEDEGFEWND